MADKRYSVTFEEEVYRQIRTHAYAHGQTIGEFITTNLAKALDVPLWLVTDEGLERTKSVDEPVNKELNVQRAKVTPSGKLSKGLGDLPGQEPKTPQEQQHQRDEWLNRMKRK